MSHDGIIWSDTAVKKIALVFTGDKFGDGGAYISKVLKKENVHGSK